MLLPWCEMADHLHPFLRFTAGLGRIQIGFAFNQNSCQRNIPVINQLEFDSCFVEMGRFNLNPFWHTNHGYCRVVFSWLYEIPLLIPSAKGGEK